MKDKEVVEKLLKGSAHIDRMRWNTDQVIRMIINLVLKKHRDCDSPFKFPQDREMHESESAGDFTWDMYYRPEDARLFAEKNGISFAFHQRQRDGQKLCLYSFRGKDNKSDAGCPEYVQDVYRNLHLLIALVRRVFPFLEQQWKPFLQAADANLD